MLRPLILGEKAPHERFRYTMIGWSPSRPEYNGRMLNEIADAEGKDPYELQCDILLGDRPLTSGIFHTMCEDDLKRVMQWPRTMVGCDGIAFHTRARWERFRAYSGNTCAKKSTLPSRRRSAG